MTVNSNSSVVRICDDADARHHWVGNDKKGKNSHHGIVKIDENPFTLHLSWMTSSEGCNYFIGTYRLNLRALLDEGYVRWKDESQRTVLLRFEHDRHGFIRIATKQDANGITIGWLTE
jgi:hypothetical protein